MDETFLKRFWSKVDRRDPDDCWPWLASTTNGYGNIILDGIVVKAHRVAFEMEYWKIPDGLHCCHECDNRLCVNPAHLWLGTNSDNVRDRHEKGRSRGAIGEANTKAKLTTADVLEIRASTGKIADVAKIYGVTDVTISYVRLRRIWKHIP